VGTGLAVGVGLGVIVDVGVAVGMGVELGLRVGVTVAKGVIVGVTVGGTVGVGVPVEVCTSNEPISIRPFTTRSKPGPRWSKKGGSEVRVACVNRGTIG
jgi:hypothetical protein